jgi:prepilin peptidase CpaA
LRSAGCRPALGIALLCSLAVFAIGAAGFAAGILGGGDVKLLAAASLFAGSAHLIDFLVVTALVGGALGLAVLAGAPIGPAAPATDGTVRARLRCGLPYGPAIAAGGLWVIAALYAP